MIIIDIQVKLFDDPKVDIVKEDPLSLYNTRNLLRFSFFLFDNKIQSVKNIKKINFRPDNWDPFDFNPNIRCEIPYSSKTTSMSKSNASQNFKVLNLVCEICKKKFSTISHLVHHRKKLHQSSNYPKC